MCFILIKGMIVTEFFVILHGQSKLEVFFSFFLHCFQETSILRYPHLFGFKYMDYQITTNTFKIGQYLYVDKSVWGKFLRIRVRLDVRNPLVTGFWVLPHIWIRFKYENLGLFCYKCGRITNHM